MNGKEIVKTNHDDGLLEIEYATGTLAVLNFPYTTDWALEASFAHNILFLIVLTRATVRNTYFPRRRFM